MSLGNHALSASEDCEDDVRLVASFNRVLTVTYDGPSSPLATEDDFKRVLSPCSDMDDFLNDMLKYFSSLGLDVSDPNIKQYPSYFSPQFNITYRVNEHSSNRVILGSFYDFGEYMDSKIHLANVDLVFNSDVTSMNGERNFNAGSFLIYGNMRLV